MNELDIFDLQPIVAEASATILGLGPIHSGIDAVFAIVQF
jgi:hypothetical protein